MNKKKLTVAQVVDAIEQNGYKQSFGQLYNYGEGSACAIGQGALNLGVNANDLSRQLNLFSNISFRGKLVDLASYIIQRNDNLHHKPQSIAKSIRINFPQLLEHTLEVDSIDPNDLALKFERVS